MSATQESDDIGNTLVVPADDAATTLLKTISTELETVDPCMITIEKYWSEERNMFVISTYVHDLPPEGDLSNAELRRAQAHLWAELHGLYRLGFGRISAEVNITSGRKRAVTITAGATRRFTVPFEDSQRNP